MMTKRAAKYAFGEASFNQLFSKYQREAKYRGLIFDLFEDTFRELTKQSCYYCGIAPKQEYKQPACNGGYVYNGIDRVNNLLGYLPSNCVSCCKICNNAKSTMTVQEFNDWVDRVVKNRENR